MRRLRRRARALGRAMALATWTLALGLPVLMSDRADIGRPGTGGARWRYRVFCLWSRGTLRLCGARMNLMGSPPRPPFYLVCNHLGYIDIVALAAVLGDAVFLAQHGVAQWPVVGALARAVGTIFVNRGDPGCLPAVNRAVESALAAGRSVVVFPEGTSTPGLTVAPFMSPVLDPAARRGQPVHAASLTYHCPTGEPPAYEAVCWWGGMTFGDHLLRLLEIPRFDIGLHFLAEPITNGDRKRLARDLRAHVTMAFVPTATGDEACRIPWP